MIFHLVSRLHRREAWFVEELRDEIVALIQRCGGRTDSALLAYAVMPNHLHILLRQGHSPLSAVMQPLMRNVAHLVQARHRFDGAVVERRYRDRLCATPDHVREALVYIHLNAWRAGLCDDGLDYPWHSHPAYRPGGNPAGFGIAEGELRAVLALFGQRPERSEPGLREDYVAWLRWRMEADLKATAGAAMSVRRPGTDAGDRAWLRSFGRLPNNTNAGGGKALPDLRDYVSDQLRRIASGQSIQALQGSWLSRPLSRRRAQLIRSAAERGYRTGRIAEFFCVSPTTVSKAKYADPEESM